MNAYLISIGDELLIGQTINTNAGFIGSLLTDNQITVAKTSVIGDEEAIILEEFALAWEKADIIIVTGGLGPTHDDITRKVVTLFFKSELQLNEEVLEDIRSRFDRLKRTMVKVNEEQALVPKIAVPIRNYRGTAPGFWIEKDNKYFIAMPGVPHEMKEMMSGYVIPKFREIFPNPSPFTCKTTLLTTGIPESTLFEKLGNIEDLLQGAKLAFLPNPDGVKMRITVSEATEQEALAKLSSIEQKIRSLSGRFIYGKNEEDMAEIVGRL
ncbi:MAG: competence/damage-inducible protein A, partial [Ignavibacteriales bacterium]|nr:competence/damage-inducible protein A [Ignavibacteriales bacterium]